MHCVDLGESFPTHVFLQNLASIQLRTSPVKFACSPRTDPPGLGRNAAAAPEDGCAFYCYVALRAVCSAGWQLIEVQKPQIRPLSHEVTFESSYFHVSIKYSAQAVSASLIFVLFSQPSLLFFSNAAEVSRSGGRRGFGSSGREELRSREETVRRAATRCKRNNFAKM